MESERSKEEMTEPSGGPLPAWAEAIVGDGSSPVSLLLGYGVDTAVKYGLDTGFGFIQTVCAIVGVVGVGAATKNLLYPQARPVEPLYNRLRQEGGPLPWPHLRMRFEVKPYRYLSHDKIVILQGGVQAGKTTLLRTAIPWYHRWTVWPMTWLCWRGLYFNGAEGGRNDTFQQWVTFQMFGRTQTAGSELKRCLWAYRKQQWFRLMMEKLRVPVKCLLPKPVFMVVDHFEELMRKYPDQALSWAESVSHSAGRNNVARIVFVVNSDAGAQSLLNLAAHGLQYKRILLEPPTLLPNGQASWRHALIDVPLLLRCNGNVGLYTVVSDNLCQGSLKEKEVDGFVARALARWKRDYSLPFPLGTHQSWLDLELLEAKRELANGLASLLHVPSRTPDENYLRIRRIFETVTPALELLDTVQLFDTPMKEWTRILANAGTAKPALSVQDARVVAKHLRRLMGNPIGTFQHRVPKAALVWLPKIGLVTKTAFSRTSAH